MAHDAMASDAQPFPDSEYESRQRAFKRAMDDARLDAVLLYHQESLYYLYGYDQIGYWVYQAFVVPRSGDPVAICRRADADMIEASPWVHDVRVWMDDSEVDPGQLTAQVVSDLGLLKPGVRIGVERKAHSLLPYYWDLVREHLDGATELVDASDLVSDLRIVKSPLEQESMRQAASIMDAAFGAGFATLGDRVRESDVHAAVVRTMYERGGEHPAVAPPIASGPRTLTQTHGAATRRRIRTGDAVTVEIGAAFNRYHAVGLRSGFVGRPPASVERLHASLVAALETGLAGVRPNMASAELAGITLDELDRQGFDRRGRHVGYGIGIGYPPTWLDSLRIKETDEHLLVPGTTFFFFLGAFSDDRATYLGVGDPVLVTADGGTVLSTVDRRLHIVS